METLRRYSNRSDLLNDYARVHERAGQGSTESEPDDPELVAKGRRPRDHLLSNRLSETDVQAIISEYRSGVTGRELSTKYNISAGSLKKILRVHGARRKDQPARSSTNYAGS